MQHDHTGVLLADIGGTTARFACLREGVLGPVEHLASHDYASFDDALSDFLARRDPDAPLSAAALAVAGVINEEHCALTNIPWVIDAAELRERFGFSFEAKGRLRFYVEAVPVDVILNTDAAFVGLRSLAASRLEPAGISPLSSAASNASKAISSVATRCTEDRQSANR